MIDIVCITSLQEKVSSQEELEVTWVMFPSVLLKSKSGTKRFIACRGGLADADVMRQLTNNCFVNNGSTFVVSV